MSRVLSQLKAYFSESYMLLIAFALAYPVTRMIFILKIHEISPYDTFLYVFIVLFSYYILRGIKEIVAYSILIIECVFIGVIIIHWLNYSQLTIPYVFNVSEYIYNFFNIETFVILLKETVTYILTPNGIIHQPILFEIFLFILIPGLFYYLVFNYRRPSYLILASMIFIYAWGLYYDESIDFILYYAVGLLLYTYEYYHQKRLSLSKETHNQLTYYHFNQLRLTYLIVGILIFGISQLFIAFFPLDRINSAVSTYVPDTGVLRSAYQKQKSYGYYTLENSMYHPLDNRLGGSVIQDSDDLLFLVDYDGQEGYLRGRVKNKYTGERWINENTSYNNENKFTTTNPLKRMDIELTNLDTISLFSPYQYIKSNFKSEFVFSNEDGIQLYKGPKSVSLATGYTIYYDPLYSEELGPFEKQAYLGIPSSGLSYTKSLTQSIVSVLDNDYDKMMALQSYLRENQAFSYSLEVTDDRSSRDFVESFLKYEKTGYCTYYASALAMMGRMADIPTRYVEGFLIPDEPNNDGLYEVTESRAHAWVEAYIEGRGWIVLEATPVYRLSSEESLEATNTVESFDDTLDLSSLEEDRFNSEKDLEIEETIVIDDSRESGTNYFVYWGLFFILCLGSIILLLIRKYNQRLKAYELMSCTNKGSVLLSRIEYLMKLQRIKRPENQFIHEYFNDALKRLNLDIDLKVNDIIIRHLFDKNAISKEDVKVLEGFVEDTFNKLYDKKNTVIRHFYHWLMIRN